MSVQNAGDSPVALFCENCGRAKHYAAINAGRGLCYCRGDQASLSFDRRRAEAERVKGQNLAAVSRADLLAKVRVALVVIASSRADRCVTADDAQQWLIDHGYNPTDLGNAAGSLFKDGSFIWTGRYAKSARVSNHSREFRVWRLFP